MAFSLETDRNSNNIHSFVLAIYAIGKLGRRFISWIQQVLGIAEKVKDLGIDTLPPTMQIEGHDEDNFKDKLKPTAATLVLSTGERIERLKTKYNLLVTKDPLVNVESSYVIPKRRVCDFGGMESEELIERAKNAHLVSEEEIVEVHPMKFLPNSPFIKTCTPKFQRWITDEATWTEMVATAEKQAQSIAITTAGKHVILQPAVKACVPACIAMLLLDRGKKPNYQEMQETNLANTQRAIEWVNEAKLECQITEIPQDNAIDLLSKRLAEKGPGKLSIEHPTIGSHAIILDEISREKGEALIRDPFHGWMLTIKLDALSSWLCPGDDFLQIL